METIKILQEIPDRRPAGGLIQAACDIGLSSAWACGHPGLNLFFEGDSALYLGPICWPTLSRHLGIIFRSNFQPVFFC